MGYRYTLLFCFMIFLNFSCLSQSTFSKVLRIVGGADSGWSVLDVDDGILCVTVTNFNNGSGTLGLVKTDYDGELEWYRFYDSLGMYTYESVILKGDYLYINGFHRSDTIDEIRFVKFDLEGNVITSIKSGANYEGERARRLIQTTNQFVASHFLPGDDRYAWLQFYDNDMELLDEILYPEEASHGLIGESDLISSSDGGIISATLELDIRFNPVISKLSETGEIEWVTALESFHYFSLLDIAEFGDGTIALGWYKGALGDLFGIPPPPAIYGLSATGDSLWNYSFEANTEAGEAKYIASLQSLSNGDIIGVGLHQYYPDEEADLEVCAWYFRMNSNGELLWERRVCVENNFIPDQALINATELEDGSLVLSGFLPTIVSGPPISYESDIWLIKVDSMGCLEPGCDDFQIVTDTDKIIKVVQENEFTIFPNPANDLLYIKFDQSNINAQTVRLELFNASGQLLEAQSFFVNTKKQLLEFDIADLPTGCFFYRMTDEKGTLLQTKMFLKQ